MVEQVRVRVGSEIRSVTLEGMWKPRSNNAEVDRHAHKQAHVRHSEERGCGGVRGDK